MALYTVFSFEQAFQNAPDCVAVPGPYLMLEAAEKVPANVVAAWEVEGVNAMREAMAAVMASSVGANKHPHIKVHRVS